ncbi:Mov34/MPN/PAD-1 family protein [Cytobacillus sp. FSL K6-0265]|uniref:Mov34/MPN/PAD-1 family protein n=1 Tax=Cytobacillus sp. FSL K6-0265 TaxID=2921448 RepID=UPI0030F86CEA
MNNLIFTESNQRFKISIPNEILIEVQKLCELSFPNETGGILVGSYSEEFKCADVSGIIVAPPDSKSGPTWFSRGTNGVKGELDRLWFKKKFYIGEWHYHPGSSSNLSSQDIKQMINISNNENYKCPEPILLIVGGKSDLWEYSGYVFPKGKPFVYLISE